METLADLQLKLDHMALMATELKRGMATIASGLLTLQGLITEHTALVQTLREQLIVGTIVTQEQVDALGEELDDIQVTLQEALGNEQAILALLAPPPPA